MMRRCELCLVFALTLRWLAAGRRQSRTARLEAAVPFATARPGALQRVARGGSDPPMRTVAAPRIRTGRFNPTRRSTTGPRAGPAPVQEAPVQEARAVEQGPVRRWTPVRGSASHAGPTSIAAEDSSA